MKQKKRNFDWPLSSSSDLLSIFSPRRCIRWLCACHLRNNTIPEYPDCLNSVIALIPVILTHLLLHSSLDSLW